MPNIRLDANFISSAKARSDSQDATYFDDRVVGFGLRVKPSGVRTFFLQYRDPFGRQRRIAIGPAQVKGSRTGVSAAVAYNRAIKLRASIVDGKDPATEKQAKRAAKTVADLCDEYLLASKNRIKASTLAVDKSRIEAHVKPLLGKRMVASLTHSDLEKFVADIERGATAKKKPVEGKGTAVTGGASVAARTLGMLGTILQRAVRDGTLVRNPAHGVAKPKEQPVKPPFSFETVKRVGKSLAMGAVLHESAEGLAVIRFLMLTGVRRMEALTLRWGRVDFAAQCLRLADTKSGPQTRPIGKSAIELLESHKPRKAKDGDYVFVGIGKEGHFVGAPKAWARVAERAKVSGVSLHGLRHWFASAAAEMNYSELTIAGLLGHSVRSVTGRYATTPDSALIAAADDVSKRIVTALGAEMDLS